MNSASKTDPSQNGPADDRLARVTGWLEQFATHVRSCSYEQARALFSDSVVGFGTRAYRVVNLKGLEQQQWREIWDNSTGFTFDLGELSVFGDGNVIAAAVPWTSVGYDATGAPFQRPGRATLVFVQEGERLLAVHTHFSLTPGLTDKTYPKPPAASD